MITPFQPEHLEGFIELNRICGFPERSEAGWRWVFFDNPDQGNEPPGYVLFRKGEMAGVVGIHRRVYRRRDARFNMAAGHTLISHLKSPGTGMKLVSHVIRTHGCDATSTLNNNALSAPIHPRIGMMPWRGERGREYLEYPLDWSRLIASRGLNGLTGRGFHVPKFGRERLSSRLKNFEGQGGVGTLERIDPFNSVSADQLDVFNEELQSGEAFSMNRSADVWRYRLSDPDYENCAALFARKSGGRITGLLSLSLSKEDVFSTGTLEIEDLAALPGDEGFRNEALSAAVEIGRECRAARARWRILPDNLDASALKGWVVRRRDYDTCQAKVPDHILSHLPIGPADGDFFFALRRPDKFRTAQCSHATNAA